VLGAAGLVIGYAIYQHRMEQGSGSDAVEDGSAVKDGSADGFRQLAAKLDALTVRVSAMESRTSGGEWLEMIASRFTAMEERMTVQNERIHSVEQNYGRIERDLDAILRALHRPALQVLETPVAQTHDHTGVGEPSVTAA